jgi:hypothetical protein
VLLLLYPDDAGEQGGDIVYLILSMMMERFVVQEWKAMTEWIEDTDTAKKH